MEGVPKAALTRRVEGYAGTSLPELPQRQENRCLEVVKKVALVAMHVLLSAVACFLFLNCFLAGFVVGFIFSDYAQKTVDAIKAIWSKIPTPLQPPAAIVAVVTCFFAPITWPVGTFLYGAYIGKEVRQLADALLATSSKPGVKRLEHFLKM